MACRRAPAAQPPVVERLNQSGSQLCLSDVSVWELSLKWQAGKLRLPVPPRIWLKEQSRQWNLLPVGIERRDIYRMSELPLHHADPFDRLLVTQAIERGMTILPPDAAIHCYPVAAFW